jgi:tetratricopeptide (TPR) repeat protein
MDKIKMIFNEFNTYIKEATNELENFKFHESYKTILKALNENPNAPEPHNLLGIWYELQGNNDLARKHYRAAYALDPTYKPASKNLERVCTFFLYENIPVDFGKDISEESDKVNSK